MIREAISILQPQAKQKAIKLDVTLDESLAPLVADPRRLSQVVVALITNAIKFSANGGHVGVSLEREGELEDGVLRNIAFKDGLRTDTAVWSRLRQD